MSLRSPTGGAPVDRKPQYRRTNRLTRGTHGKYSTFTLATDMTFNICMELSAHAYSFRLFFPNAHTAAVSGLKVSIAPTAFNHSAHYLNNPQPSGGVGTWIDVPLGQLPARTEADRPTWTATAAIPMLTIPRTQGRDRPMIMVRVQAPAGTVMTKPAQDIYGWRVEGTHHNERVSQQAVLGVDNKAAFTNNSSIDTNCPIPVVEYQTFKQGLQVGMCGDSLTMGQGGNVRDFGAVQRACMALTTLDNPIEYYNWGILGQQPRVYAPALLDTVGRVDPGMLFYSPYSVNDAVVGGLTDTAYASVWENLALVMRGAPVTHLLEGLPTNKNFRNTGAGDARRRDINARLAQFTGAKLVKGYAAAISGEQASDGQTLIATGMAAGDGGHLLDSGFDALAAVIRKEFG